MLAPRRIRDLRLRQISIARRLRVKHEYMAAHVGLPPPGVSYIPSEHHDSVGNAHILRPKWGCREAGA